MFWLSKLIQSTLLPSNCLALLAVVGLVALALGRRKLAMWIFGIATVLMAIAGWSPLGPTLLTALEDRFPQPSLPDKVAGVVMLGGAVNIHISQDRGQIALNDNAERVFAIAALARRYPQARIIISGGIAHEAHGNSLTEAEGARQVLVDLGVSAGRIELEDKSRTTFENAAQSLRVAQPVAGQSWLLVTSAFNMPRAVASFRGVGFSVVPYPVDYRTRPSDLLRPVATLAEGLEDMDVAAHEWLGLVAYRLTGKTSELLPSADR